MYELDPACFLTAPGLAWQAALKRAKVKLDFLTDTDLLLMVKKAIKGVIYHAIYWYVKDNNIYMETYDQQKELSYLKYWNVNNLYGWSMSKRLPLGRFKWVEETF